MNKSHENANLLFNPSYNFKTWWFHRKYKSIFQRVIASFQKIKCVCKGADSLGYSDNVFDFGIKQNGRLIENENQGSFQDMRHLVFRGKMWQEVSNVANRYTCFCSSAIDKTWRRSGMLRCNPEHIIHRISVSTNWSSFGRSEKRLLVEKRPEHCFLGIRERSGR